MTLEICILVSLVLLCPSKAWTINARNRVERFRHDPLQQALTDQQRPQVVDQGISTSHGAISMSIPELAEVLGGYGRAKIVWDCYRIGVDPSVDEMDDASIQALLPSMRRTQKLGVDALEKLSQTYGNSNIHGGVAALSHVRTSRDLTTKLLLRLRDGTEVETVIIPWNGIRSTLCISSQVGCRQGCRFCATGKMGKVRSLTSDEILAQMFYAKRICRQNNLPDVTNVVFMGMGEPADNAEAVVRAVKQLTTRELFQLSANKVTVSTVAPQPSSFSLFSSAPCVLAWSVHATRDALRRQLVPTTQYPMVELRQGFIFALLQRPPNMRTVMLEVTLIDQVNSSIREADELAEFARGIVDTVPGCKLIVNLIPYNDIGYEHLGFSKPENSKVRAFQQQLWSHGVYAHIRTTRGDDESAACGQLVTLKQRTLEPSVM